VASRENKISHGDAVAKGLGKAGVPETLRAFLSIQEKNSEKT
jgi:hypothetical protein